MDYLSADPINARENVVKQPNALSVPEGSTQQEDRYPVRQWRLLWSFSLLFGWFTPPLKLMKKKLVSSFVWFCSLWNTSWNSSLCYFSSFFLLSPFHFRRGTNMGVMIKNVLFNKVTRDKKGCFKGPCHRDFPRILSTCETVMTN